MKHRSLAGPLFLIGLGVLLLVNNLRPELPLWDLVLEYWPVLLIAWGTLRLLEITAAAMRSQPLPRAGLSNGEWVVVILICLFGAGSRAVRTHWVPGEFTLRSVELFGHDYHFPVAATVPCGEAPRVLIHNLRGRVRITGGPRHEVKVQGRTTVRTFDPATARKIQQECPLTAVSVNGQVIVRTNQERLHGDGQVTSELEITVPQGASVETTGRAGEVDVSNLAGDVAVERARADVRLAKIGGNARLKLQRSNLVRILGLKGSVDLRTRGEDVELERIAGGVTLRGFYSGELSFRKIAGPLEYTSRRTQFHVEGIPGEVRMRLGSLTGDRLKGPLRLRGRYRDVRWTDFTGPAKIALDRGDVELRPGHKTISQIHVKLHAGDIELVVPQGAEFGLWAKTSSGRIENDYGPALTPGAAPGRGATLAGPAAQPVTIRLETGRGDVVIRKLTTPAGKPAAAPAPLTVERH